MDFDLNRFVQVNAEEHLENDEVPEEWTREHRQAPVLEKQEAIVSRIVEPSPVPTTPEIVQPAPPHDPGRFLGSLFDTVQFFGKKEAPHD